MDKSHNTPLLAAAHQGHDEVVALLVDRGANPKHPNKHGKTPLSLAKNGGHQECVDILNSAIAKRSADEEVSSSAPKKTRQGK